MTSVWRRILHATAAVTALAVLGLIVYGGLRLAGPSATPIRWVEVSGSFERVAADQVRLATASVAGTGFFALDPEDVRRRVAEIPWVAAVDVGKRWPDTVVVRVFEHHALARWGEDRLVSASGDLFEVHGDHNIAGLPKFEGDDGLALEMIEFYHRAREMLKPTGFDVTELSRSARGAWRMRLDSAVDVELGSDEPLKRFERFVSSLDQLGPQMRTRAEGVDLRYSNGFAIRWSEAVDSAIEPNAELMPASYSDGEAL